MRTAPVVRPRDVPGFAAAVAAGQTPTRPESPPAVREPTSYQEIVKLGIRMAVSTAAAIVCVFSPLQPLLGPATLPVYLTALAVGYLVSRSALHRYRAVLLEELQAGYVTCTFEQGLFWHGDGRAEDVVGWDWSGLWTLTSDGRVLAAPDLSADPPGMYPSPQAPGRRELWTGCRWTGVLHDVACQRY